jgi:hypothetical protein
VLRFALLASVIVLAAGSAAAQTLPGLTLTALSITSDRTAAPEGEAFHLRIHVHTKQPGADLSSLVLPDVVNLTILGDEKRTASARDGTDYIETLTVAGVSPGEASVTPAYIDARDPSRGDKPFRFSSNRLSLRITGSASPGVQPLVSTAMHAARIAVAVVIALIVLLAIGFLIVRTRAFAGKRKAYTTLPRARPVATPVTVAPVDRRAEVRNAALGLASNRTRSAATLVRTALFALAGARSDETLLALLERVPKEQRALRAALRAAERAVFIEESHLQGAIDELLDAVRAVDSI